MGWSSRNLKSARNTNCETRSECLAGRASAGSLSVLADFSGAGPRSLSEWQPPAETRNPTSASAAATRPLHGSPGFSLVSYLVPINIVSLAGGDSLLIRGRPYVPRRTRIDQRNRRASVDGSAIAGIFLYLGLGRLFHGSPPLVPISEAVQAPLKIDAQKPQQVGPR